MEGLYNKGLQNLLNLKCFVTSGSPSVVVSVTSARARLHPGYFRFCGRFNRAHKVDSDATITAAPESERHQYDVTAAGCGEERSEDARDAEDFTRVEEEEEKDEENSQEAVYAEISMVITAAVVVVVVSFGVCCCRRCPRSLFLLSCVEGLCDFEVRKLLKMRKRLFYWLLLPLPFVKPTSFVNARVYSSSIMCDFIMSGTSDAAGRVITVETRRNLALRFVRALVQAWRHPRSVKRSL